MVALCLQNTLLRYGYCQAGSQPVSEAAGVLVKTRDNIVRTEGLSDLLADNQGQTRQGN